MSFNPFRRLNLQIPLAGLQGASRSTDGLSSTGILNANTKYQHEYPKALDEVSGSKTQLQLLLTTPSQ